MINGLPPVSSKRRIWLARPTPVQHGCYEILPVNWEAITEAGSTETNWQIFPGDRVYVKADPLITLDNTLAKVLSPIERVFGATLLGSATVQSFRGLQQRQRHWLLIVSRRTPVRYVPPWRQGVAFRAGVISWPGRRPTVDIATVWRAPKQASQGRRREPI